jgi:hypothetical protein
MLVLKQEHHSEEVNWPVPPSAQVEPPAVVQRLEDGPVLRRTPERGTADLKVGVKEASVPLSPRIDKRPQHIFHTHAAGGRCKGGPEIARELFLLEKCVCVCVCVCVRARGRARYGYSGSACEVLSACYYQIHICASATIRYWYCYYYYNYMYY